MGPRQRKGRQVRDEAPLDDTVLVVRGNLLVPAILTTTAAENFEVYGFYGAPVWATTGGATRESLLATKLSRQQVVAIYRAGDLRSAGLELRPTGVARTTVSCTPRSVSSWRGSWPVHMR